MTCIPRRRACEAPPGGVGGTLSHTRAETAVEAVEPDGLHATFLAAMLGRTPVGVGGLRRRESERGT